MRNYFLLITVLLFATSCGGRVPVETIVHQVGDEEKDCGELKLELDYIEAKAGELAKSQDKSVRNVGLLLLSNSEPAAPLLMDLSLADKRELSALRKRYNHLVRIALSKECGPDPLPPDSPPENIRELIQQKEPAGRQ